MFEKLNPFSGPSAVSEVTELRIYPIKSCRGISIKKSYLTRRGLDLDRRWMFVDAETLKFVTIRDISEMTLIDTAFTSTSDTSSSAPSPTSPTSDSDAEQLIISIRNTDKKVMVPARPTTQWLEDNTELKQVNIWEYITDGYIYSDTINNVFTDLFKKPVKLVYKGPTPRILRGNGAPELLGREESTNFPDVMPLQIANEASIKELNQRLKEKGHEEITIERFRPNIIVKGADTTRSDDKAPGAWSEDSWKTVRILDGEQPSGIVSMLGGRNKGLEIDVQARCARCQVPNVDPETAEKDKHEPWDTLVSYRRVDEGIKWKPCFGMLSAPRNEGPIAVGMKFEVTETTDAHKYVKGF
ncbi:probable MOSC domain-containing protein 2, mitochondrial precursor [Phialocephala subalpina]|uniref:Probable MOSC domain-containing protein 2, mitochondrial n=1 Tax=Phialocephala subalpina TaxID=576137 RepID=A0A1L7XUX2_9HELO|nr:probable MOSC domain-containing protein 2, mitochondrial precursor [Phialocephala subalpina]